MHLIQIAGISYLAFEASRKELEMTPAEDAQADIVQQKSLARVVSKVRELVGGLFPSRSHLSKQAERN